MLKDTIGEKKIKGRKRHILVDTQGVLLTAHIDGANEQDGESFLKMFEEKPINSLCMIWADSAYRRAYLKEALARRKIELSIVGGGLKEGFWISKDQIMNFEIPPKKFQVQPRRWVVERTFAWLNRNRRLYHFQKITPYFSASKPRDSIDQDLIHIIIWMRS